MSRCIRSLCVSGAVLLSAIVPATASESITYSYDALGGLDEVETAADVSEDLRETRAATSGRSALPESSGLTPPVQFDERGSSALSCGSLSPSAASDGLPERGQLRDCLSKAKANLREAAAVTESADPTIEAIAFERRRIEKYLRAQFRDRGVDVALLQPVMLRMDELTSKENFNAGDDRVEGRHSYPSVALQIAWQVELGKIANRFRRAFRVHPVPPGNHLDVVIQGLPPRKPDLNEIRYTVAQAIEEAQGKFGIALLERPLPPKFELPLLLSPARESFGTFAGPVRIAPTQMPVIDDAIPGILAKLRAADPAIKIDDASFPSSIEAANVIMPPTRLGWDTVDWLNFCIRRLNCASLDDFARDNIGDDLAGPSQSHLAFLNSLYLTNPYGGHRSTTAVLQLRSDGSIAAAFCSLADAGYTPSHVRDPLRLDKLKECLTEAITPAIALQY